MSKGQLQGYAKTTLIVMVGIFIAKKVFDTVNVPVLSNAVKEV